MSITEIDHSGPYRFTIALPDGGVLYIHITEEGLILDLFGEDEEGFIGTIGRTFDEWADTIKQEV
jgi:hypothetical protein